MQFLIFRLRQLDSFFVVGILSKLSCCRLGLKNLDAFVTNYNNWLNDAWIGCHLANKDVVSS
jgi:hypothetical protein